MANEVLVLVSSFSFFKNFQVSDLVFDSDSWAAISRDPRARSQISTVTRVTLHLLVSLQTRYENRDGVPEGSKSKGSAPGKETLRIRSRMISFFIKKIQLITSWITLLITG